MCRVVVVDPFAPADQGVFEGFVGALAAAETKVWGAQGSAWSADEIRQLHRSVDQRRTALAALDGDAVVGRRT